VSRGVLEIAVSAEKLEIARDAELRDKRVDGAELHAGASTRVSEIGRRDVVVSTGLNIRQRSEPAANLGLRAVGQEPLKELLNDEAGGHDQVRRQRGT